jgi:hypothetical protein
MTCWLISQNSNRNIFFNSKNLNCQIMVQKWAISKDEVFV